MSHAQNDKVIELLESIDSRLVTLALEARSAEKTRKPRPQLTAAEKLACDLVGAREKLDIHAPTDFSSTSRFLVELRGWYKSSSWTDMTGRIGDVMTGDLLYAEGIQVAAADADRLANELALRGWRNR